MGHLQERHDGGIDPENHDLCTLEEDRKEEIEFLIAMCIANDCPVESVDNLFFPSMFLTNINLRHSDANRMVKHHSTFIISSQSHEYKVVF